MKLGLLIARALDLWTQCPYSQLEQCNWIAERLLSADPKIKQQIIDELIASKSSDAADT